MVNKNQYMKQLNTAIEYLSVLGQTQAIDMLDDCIIHNVKEHRTRLGKSTSSINRNSLSFRLTIVITLGIPVHKYSQYENAENEEWYKSIHSAFQAVFNDLNGTVVLQPKLKLVSSFVVENVENTIFGEPLTSSQFLVDIFMVMPFKDDLKPIYEQEIKPTIEKLGYSIKRGDEVFGGHFIPKEIYSLTYNSKLVIADCTGQNANVYYELGIAHMLDKKAILIAQSEDDIRFDVNQMRYLIYDPQDMQPFLEKLEQSIQLLLGNNDSTTIASLF